MITLGLDTTGAWCTAALVSPSHIISQASEKIGRGHAERLAPMVETVLLEGDVKPAQISRIAVCTGPGSFTGLRVALAFARAMALPRKVPVIGLSALRVLAAQTSPSGTEKIISAINAKRGEVCWAAYENGHEVIRPRTQAVEIAKAEIQQLQFDNIIGDGAALIGLESAGQNHVSGPALAWLSLDYDPVNYPPAPLYMRGPDAKLPGGKTPQSLSP